jgi:outer membrane protein insertion porin family
LFHLNYFKDVQIEPLPTVGEDENYYDLTFRVEEKSTGTASMGAGYSDRDKLVGQVGLNIPNLRGNGQNLDFSWEFGTRREQFLVGFTEPWLLDTPTSLSVRVYTMNQEYYDAFERKRNSITVRLGRRLDKPKYSTISLGYSLIDERYSNFSERYESDQNSGRFQERTTSAFDLNFTRDTRDFPQFPTKGNIFSYRPELAATFVGSEVNFHSHEVQFNYYLPSFWKFVFSVESKLAVIDGFSDRDDRELPFFNRYTPGGVDMWDGQVRGYNDASLGPRSEEGLILGGRSMMILNLEYRFPLVEQQVYGLLFADAGNAWDGALDINPMDLRRSFGLGFRVMTPMLGMLGFDFGYGFDRSKVDGSSPGWNTHFQFGPRFF